ncbi:hypothetical protein RJ639_039133 [Escallonia herrerae]|uniref:ENTH domain-containing protein n=1 Tax=Escallonia herrerae TaxID=1293975 RepID=A0AA88WMU7_9ASTE|nr:hypothetical protein RJ639_039133 [Escallonia herrerae]
MKTARLALTDVTPAELLTEEATNGDLWAPDTRTMGIISRAAFEVDDYWRIVEILHKRLWKFEKNNWRPSYKALILLEYLLTHGPERVAEEFYSDKNIIKEMRTFQYVDEKGFNWGISIKMKSDKILKLLEDRLFFKEERARARKLTSGIKGFGSFCHKSPKADGSLEEATFGTYKRYNSSCNDCRIQDEEDTASTEEFFEGRIGKTQQIYEQDHPFCDDEHQTKASLLS